MVVDATATPVMAQALLEQIRKVTDKPVTHVLLTHYHAVRVMGASGFEAREIIASDATRELIEERGQEDFESEVNRFPRLFRAVETVPGLTWPTMTFETRDDGLARQAAGRDHATSAAATPRATRSPGCRRRRCCSAATWSSTAPRPTPAMPISPTGRRRSSACAALGAARLVPGRGDALTDPAEVSGRHRRHPRLPHHDVRQRQARRRRGQVAEGGLRGDHALLKPRFGHWVIFEHCMPFDVARAYDEARGQVDPRIWTKQRDLEMWRALQG